MRFTVRIAIGQTTESAVADVTGKVFLSGVHVGVILQLEVGGKC